MDGIHDCGGMHGFGQVVCEENEPFFHAEWEKRVFAISMAMPFISLNSDDQFRREIERMDAVHYLNSSYYEKWHVAILSLAKEYELASDQELDGGAILPIPQRFKDNSPAIAEETWDNIHSGASQAMSDAGVPARFRVGDKVRTSADVKKGHTRLPRYARDKVGVIEKAWTTFIYADDHAENSVMTPVHLYTVVFASTALWGNAGVEGDSVTLDLFEPYMELEVC